MSAILEPAVSFPECAISTDALRVEEVRPDGLADHLPAWRELAASALDPNVFYEPWMLAPAIEFLSRGADLRILFVYRGATLCGVFPLALKRHYRGLPVRTLTLWKHKYCYLSVPMLHAEQPEETFRAFMDWCMRPEATLVEFKELPVDSGFHQLLVNELNRRDRPWVITRSYTRALMRKSGDAESYIQGAFSSFRRKEQRRLMKRLSELGSVEFRETAAGNDVGAWVDEFLKLEAGGWKGESGTALGSSNETAAFFRSVVGAAFDRNQIRTFDLVVGGKPIAMVCSFCASTGSFTFKMAYDEAYARFSPGVLLMTEYTRRVFAEPDIEWVDSCAVSDHSMMNRQWTERRTVQRFLLSCNAFGDAFIYFEPLRARMEQMIRRRFGKKS